MHFTPLRLVSITVLSWSGNHSQGRLKGTMNTPCKARIPNNKHVDTPLCYMVYGISNFARDGVEETRGDGWQAAERVVRW
jgi:hypothetical protein